MEALVNLIIVVMVEAGRVPLKSAMTIGQFIMQKTTGGTGENNT